MSEDEAGAEPALHLFEGYGIELEYMIVGREDLVARPICDEVLKAVAGEFVSEVELGPTAWSNELVLHVIELKTNGPAETLEDLPALFDHDLLLLDEMLALRGARLLPTGMHPWFDPASETKLWPHDYGPTYAAFDRIFDCKGHGWSNLQSMHINLPFSGDDEFARLHAAIRLILPLLPGLAASTPFVSGQPTGSYDNRLRFYRDNAKKVPSVTGLVVPEAVWSKESYEREILGRIYQDMAAQDPEGTLRHEWVNARGAIARFDRDAIEIRLLDMQECPEADLAVAALVVAVIKDLVVGRVSALEEQQAVATAPLSLALDASIERGESAVIEVPGLLSALGFPDQGRASAGELWHHLYERCKASGSLDGRWQWALDQMLKRGTLAGRLLTAAGKEPSRHRLGEIYAELADCLLDGRIF